MSRNKPPECQLIVETSGEYLLKNQTMAFFVLMKLPIFISALNRKKLSIKSQI